MSGPKRYRLLSEEEIELWRAVAETIAPRPGSHIPVRAAVVTPPPRPAPAPPVVKAVPRSVVPSYTPPQSRPREAIPPLAPLERQYRRKVTRGHVGIERVMDLHGLNQAEAHGALRGFLRTAQRDGMRLVLVVTGKGQRSRVSSEPRAETGVLRRAVPHWLREPDLRGVVLGFEEAGLPHGGAGALYIRLRQSRV